MPMKFEKSPFMNRETAPAEEETLDQNQTTSEKPPRPEKMEQKSEYQKTRDKLEELCKELDSFKDVVEKMLDGVEKFAKNAKDIDPEMLSGIDVETMKQSLIGCGEIEDQEQFLDKIMEIVKPIIDIKENRKDEFEKVERKIFVEEGGFTTINELVSYGKRGDTIHMHHAPGRTFSDIQRLRYYKDAMIKLAEVVNNDPEIKQVVGASWIVAKNPKLFTMGGFKVEEPDAEHFSPETKVAIISREDLLARYLKNK